MKKNLFNVMVANGISLLISLLTNFLVPKFVSIDSYSMIKTYALYLTYAGFFSAGYNDGMYLKYGGKQLEEIKKDDLANNVLNYIVLMLLMLAIVLSFGFWLNDSIVVAFSFGMFSYNILGYLKSLYQATGEFKAYGKALNVEKIAVFLFTMVLIFFAKSDDYKLYIWTQVLVGVLVAVFLFFRLENKLHFIRLGEIKFDEYKTNISSGIVLMLGNFSSSIFTGLDRWFVKALLDSVDFAMYSFAVSLENIINVFISPVVVSMYNYFCKKPSVENIKRIKKMCLIWGFVVIAAAFPAKWILEKFLTKYMASNSVIFILFGAQIFYVIVKGIYVNIYKAEKQQNLYLRQMLAMIIVGALLNGVFYLAFKNAECIAVATLVTAIAWMYLCEFQNADLKFGLNENVTIFMVLSLYLYAGYKMDAVIGCAVYCLGTALICSVLMRDTVRYLCHIIWNQLMRMFNKPTKDTEI